MDAIASLLDGPRAHEAFLLRSVMSPPWSMRIEDDAPLTVVAITSGEMWLVPLDGKPVCLRPGDICVVRGDEHYVVADDPAREPTMIIHPGGRCETLTGESLRERYDLGVRTWGNDPDGGTSMLTGSYLFDGEVTARLLRALPQSIVLHADEWQSPVVDLLAAEIVRDEPGQEAVLDRLLDLLLISVLRAWFSRPGGDAPGWYRAHGDPVVGPALRLLQNDPARAWTVASLAHETAVSRAALARRFNDLVGEPPMTFLTNWRLTLAADLLLEPGATIASVADQVGYGSAFALSTAFKRARGVSPAEYRRARLSGVDDDAALGALDAAGGA